MNGKRRKIILIVGLAIVAGVFAYLRLYRAAPAPAEVRTTGTVEGVETDISSKIAGRLKTVRFREGEPVRAGDLLAQVESSDLEAALRQARSAERVARTSVASGREAVASAEAQVRVAGADVANARAAVSGAEANLAQAERDLARARELFGSGLLTKADLEASGTARDNRASELQGAKAALAAAESRRAAAAATLAASRADVVTREAQVAEAGNAVGVASARAADARIVSPVDAVVEYRSLEPGEVVSPGMSILTLVDLTHLWVRMDLEQRYVEGIRVGQKAFVTLENAPNKVFPAEVMDIGQEGEFAVQRDVTRGRQDIKTFRTRLRLAGGSGVLKPGMTVLVTIPLGQGARP